MPGDLSYLQYSAQRLRVDISFEDVTMHLLLISMVFFAALLGFNQLPCCESCAWAGWDGLTDTYRGVCF